VFDEFNLIVNFQPDESIQRNETLLIQNCNETNVGLNFDVTFYQTLSFSTIIHKTCYSQISYWIILSVVCWLQEKS